MEKVLFAIIFILILISIISIIISYIKIDISYFNVINKKIDKDIKIMFLSDIHSRYIYNKISNIINIEKPDIIICGGDMVNQRKEDRFLNLIPLFKNYKTYYTFGNHEEAILNKCEDEYKEYINNINKTNIILLNNKSDNITKNIRIIGLNTNSENYGFLKRNCLNKKVISDYIGDINKNNFNILIAHNPLEFNSYVEYGADLVLSGHIHGGIIIIPFLGGLLSPNYTFFPKYYKGLYKKGNTNMIVSRGVGFSSHIPFRINNNPEVVIINLKNK